MDTFTEGMILPILGLAIVIVLAVGTIVSRYKIAQPNEAIIITGSGSARKGEDDLPSAQKIVQGGGTFVVPFVQQAHRMSLESRKITVSASALSKTNIDMDLTAIAIVKVGGSNTAVRAAAQRFLTKQDEIVTFTTEVLEGSLRSIIGTMTVDEIIRDRSAFATQVAHEATSSLEGQGLELDTFTIQRIADDGDYLKNLGRPEAADARQQAEIAEANAERESESARIAAQQAVLDNQREYDLREATIREETDQAKAVAAAAGPRAEAQAQQDVVDQQRETATRQAELREQELIAEVHKKADAERYATEQSAEASKAQEIARAQAEAERVRLAAEADLERRQAEAKAVRIEGEAEAEAIRARGEAEAEAMNKKADAYARYGEAAILDQIVAVLPEVVREAAKPMESIDNMTVIDSSGASKVVQSGLDNATQGMELLKQLTNVDVSELLGQFTGEATGDEAKEEESAAAQTPAAQELDLAENSGETHSS